MSDRPKFLIPVVVLMEVEAVDFSDATHIAETLVKTRLTYGSTITLQWREDLLLKGVVDDIAEINSANQRFLYTAPVSVVKDAVKKGQQS